MSTTSAPVLSLFSVRLFSDRFEEFAYVSVNACDIADAESKAVALARKSDEQEDGCWVAIKTERL